MCWFSSVVLCLPPPVDAIPFIIVMYMYMYYVSHMSLVSDVPLVTLVVVRILRILLCRKDVYSCALLMKTTKGSTDRLASMGDLYD